MCHTFGTDVQVQISIPSIFATIVGKWIMVRLKFNGCPAHLQWITFLNVPAVIAKPVAKTRGVDAKQKIWPALRFVVVLSVTIKNPQSCRL